MDVEKIKSNLNRYRKLQQDKCKDEESLESLKTAAYPSSPKFGDGIHGTKISDKVGDLAIEISMLEDSIAEREKEIESLKPLIEGFIENIQDVQTKLIFRLYYIRGLTWKKVAEMIKGGNTELTTKQTCYRYFRTLKIESLCSGEIHRKP